MKIIVALTFLTALIAVPLPGPVAALHCNGEITTLDLPDGSTWYVDNRGEGEVWIYKETNGIEGLQSGGRNSINPQLGTDDCTHPAPRDTIYY